MRWRRRRLPTWEEMRPDSYLRFDVFFSWDENSPLMPILVSPLDAYIPRLSCGAMDK